MVLITKCFDLVYWRSGFDQYAVKLIIFFSLGDGPLTTSVSIECDANDHSNDQRSITGHCEEDLVADQSAGTSTTFTLEEELLFAQCLEEGYDLVDPKYTEWLKYNVPEHHNSLAVTTLTELPTQIAVTTHSGSTSRVTADILAGTTPLGSSSHVTTDVLAGTTPLGSSAHITTDVTHHNRCLSRYHTPGVKFARHNRCLSRYHTPGIKFARHNRCLSRYHTPGIPLSHHSPYGLWIHCSGFR